MAWVVPACFGLSCFLTLLAIVVLVLRGFDDMRTQWMFSIGADIFCMAICTMLCFSATLNTKESNADTRAFVSLLTANAIALFLDELCWIVQGIPNLRVVNLITNVLFYMTGAILIYMFWEYIRRALKLAVARSFNRVTVDGDQSTNHTCALFANGAAGLPAIAPGKPGWDGFVATLSAVALSLAKQIVMDGEGATKFVTCAVEGAATAADACAAARTIANSPLFKAACFGGDPNWGRVICAVGNSGAKCAELKTRIFFDDVCVYDRGKIASAAVNARLAAVMKQRAFEVRVDLGMGRFSDAVYTSDLSHGYVSINADYTT